MIGRYVNLLRYHRPSQLVQRARKSLLAAVRTCNPGPPPEMKFDESSRAALLHILRTRLKSLETADLEKLRDGEFCFLNDSRVLGRPVDWDVQLQIDQLWRFHLHYHEFLLEHLDFESSAVPEPVWSVMNEWVEQNPPSKADSIKLSWHPFCISRRLPVWAMLLASTQGGQQKIISSFGQQANWLHRNLEWDLEGNHLLENLRGLCFAGCSFRGSQPDRWLDTVRKIIADQISEQILPHGEHFERSSMYHAFMLELFADIAEVCRERAPDISQICDPVVDRMAQFTRSIQTPDGSLPLFGDSTRLDPTYVRTQIARSRSVDAGRNGGVSSTSSEYWIHAQRNTFLIFEIGAAGADHLPAHAHADLLNLELWLGGHPIFVDSGVFDYNATSLRQFCRSSAAHNVLQVDQASQFDQWSRFRMGYRGHICSQATGESKFGSWAEATHDAYRRFGVDLVGRRVQIYGDSVICVDWANGRGERDLETSLQLHPDAECEIVDDQSAQIRVANGHFALRGLGATTIAKREGWYCPDFGAKQPRTIIAFTQLNAPLPNALGWQITPVSTGNSATLSTTKEGWHLECFADNKTIRWERGFGRHATSDAKEFVAGSTHAAR